MAGTEQLYNNAGAVYMRKGRFKEAWDLFKGALEFHLVEESIRNDPLDCLSDMTEGFLSRAEIQYQKFVLSDDEENKALDPIATGGPGKGDLFCNFFVFRNPIEIPDDLPESDKPTLTGLIIILNLALLEHTRSPFSGQVISLYNLAASLLSGSLAEAYFEALILNNAGVWYYQSGDASIAETYFASLAVLSRTVESEPWFTAGVQRTITLNLEQFVNPNYQISPAA